MPIWPRVFALEYFYLLTKLEYLFQDNMVLPNKPLDVKLHINRHRRKYLIIGLLSAVAILIVITLLKVPSSPLKNIYTKKPAVEIKTSYKNPFDKETQYVNPFEKYKNPFVTNR